HQDVTMVVLNQMDTVPADRRMAMLDDVRRLLAADGMTTVPVMGISAKEGWGVDDLRREIARRVSAKKATKARLEADLRTAAQKLQNVSGLAGTPALPQKRVAELEEAFADAAGVPTVVEAVEESTRVRAQRATGWPVTAWVSKLRPDPLKRLHLDLGAEGKQLTGISRTSLPESTPVQRARVDAAVRELAEDVSTEVARPWATSIRKASTSRLADFSDRLDGALASTDLGADEIPGWTAAVRAMQWLLIVIALAGGVWLAALIVMNYLDMPAPVTPELVGIAWPIWLAFGGVLAGLGLAMFCRLLIASSSRKQASIADRRLRSAISEVSEELVIAPVKSELAAYDAVRGGLERALR
ncbi:MAG: ABC transporter, partial [Nocardioides sp.]